VAKTAPHYFSNNCQTSLNFDTLGTHVLLYFYKFEFQIPYKIENREPV